MMIQWVLERIDVGGFGDFALELAERLEPQQGPLRWMQWLQARPC